MNEETPGASRAGFGTAALLFVAGAVFVAWPWLSGSVTIPWDAKAHFYPQLIFLAHSLHDGQSPFWAPYVFAGTPQIADPQSLIFSPPYLLLALLNPSPSFAAADATLYALLVAGGLAVLMFFRDRHWSAIGGLVAAFCFAFGASNAWRIQHVGQVMSLCWFAIALWLLARALDRRSVQWGALAGVAAGLMVIGRDQIALMGVLLLSGYVIDGLFGAGGFVARLRARIAPLLAGAATGVITIAVPIALTMALSAQSNRAVIDYESAVKGSLHPAALLTAISANMFGTDGPMARYWGPPTTSVWGDNGLALARNMADIYFGAAPFVALLAFAWWRGGLRQREIRFFAIAALALLIYALGGYTPLFRLFYAIPGVDLFRRPADATFPLGAMLAICAGYLAHRLSVGALAQTRRQWIAGLVAVMAALALCVVVAIWKQQIAYAAPMLVISAVSLLAGFALLYFVRDAALKPRRILGALCLVALVMAFDLRVNNGPNESTALPPSTYDALRPDSRNATLAFLEQKLAATAAPDRRDRVELAAIDFHWPNVSLVRGFDHWLGYNPIRLKWFADATGAIDHVAIPDQRRFSPLFARYRSPMADLLGVRFIATGVPAERLDKQLAPGDLTFLTRTPDAYIYENPRALPRVLFANHAQAADFDAMIANGVWPDVDFRRAVLLESAAMPTAQEPRPPGEARIVRYANTEVIIDATSPQGGYVVLNDVWHPWWRVEIDGKPAPLLRANVIFRAVATPPGAHRVRFVFRPFEGLMAQMRGR